MKNTVKIGYYTFRDQIRLKSFFLFLFMAMVFLLLSRGRGCYSATYVINAQTLEGTLYFPRVIFQIVFIGVSFLTILMSMRVYNKDQNDGSMQIFFSRPVKRWEYVIGRVFGTWITVSAFMLILHCTLFAIVASHTGKFNLGYIGGSLVCSINLLFVIITVVLFSLLLPAFASALIMWGILFVGYASDGGYKLLSLEFLHHFQSQQVISDIPFWRLFYPKLFMVQAYADAIIAGYSFSGMGSFPPLLNLLLYISVLIFTAIFIFNRKAI